MVLGWCRWPGLVACEVAATLRDLLTSAKGPRDASLAPALPTPPRLPSDRHELSVTAPQPECP